MSGAESTSTEPAASTAGVSIYDLYGTSESAAEQGKWFEFGPKMRIKIRRFKSRVSRKTRERLEQPYQRLLRQGGEIPQDSAEQMLVEQIAEAIIVDWEGITSRAGEPVPYSRQAALQLLNDLPELRDEIAAISLRLDNYRDEEKKDIVKN